MEAGTKAAGTAAAASTDSPRAAAARIRLEDTVRFLAEAIGARNLYHYANLQQAETYLLERFEAAGYAPRRQAYDARGHTFANIEAELPGRERPEEIVILGAHYDTHKDSPGANDNGSALAVLLETAEQLARAQPGRTLRFVAFTNEEAPFTHRPRMGSRVYARACRKRGENVVAMICLETLGSYSEAGGSQSGSLGGHLLPDTADFLALVSNPHSRELLEQSVGALHTHKPGFHVHAITAPTHLPLAWSSDHWSFWVENYQALMLTDTAPLRYAHYHKPSDVPEHVDFRWLTEVAEAVGVVTQHLCDASVALRAARPRSPLRSPSTLLLLAAALGGAGVLLQRLARTRRR